MTLKINNDTITTTDLTGTSLTYLDTKLERLVPNKADYYLLGSPLQRQLLKEKVESTIPYKIEYTPAITDVGLNYEHATVQPKLHTIVSNFSINDYICINPLFRPGTNPWSITIRLKTPTDFSTKNQFYGASSNYYYTPGGEIDTGRHFGAGYSSNGSSWNIGWITGKTEVEPDTWYYYKTSFTGSEYKLEIRKDAPGEEYLLEGSISSTVAIYQPATTTGYICLGRQPSNYFKGSIDLSATKITVGDTIWFDGSINTSDYGLRGHLTKNISESGISYTDFGSSGNLYIPKLFTPETSSWSIILPIKTASAGTSYYPLISENTHYSFEVGIASNYFKYYLSSNGTSWTTNGVSGSNALSGTTEYKVKFEYDAENEVFTSKLLVDGEWVTDFTANTVIASPIRYLQLGTTRTNTGGALIYSINISGIQIFIDNNIWFNGLNAVTQEYSVTTPNLIVVKEPVTSGEIEAFSFNFNINSNTFTYGTKYLLELPNLVKIKTENNKLYFKFPFVNDRWKVLPNNILQAGINTLSITANAHSAHYYAYSSDNNTIYITKSDIKNQFYLKNVGSNFGKPVILADGAASSFYHDLHYLTCIDYANEAPTLTSYEFITGVRPAISNPTGNMGIVDSGSTSGTVSTRLCIGIDSKNKISYRVSTSGGTSYAVTLNSNTILPVNEWTYIKTTYSSTEGYKLFTSSDLENWTLEQENSSVTTRPYVSTSRHTLRIGDNVGGVPLSGDIDLNNTKIIINGTDVYTFGDLTVDTTIYDNAFNIIQPQPVATITDTIVTIDGVDYIRNSSADITRNEQAENLKLVVNNHNFSLLSVNELYKLKDISLTTLGIKENLVF